MPARKNLRFRQIHLDFHTAPQIPGIGARFDRKHWQQTLKTGHVDSITLFSKCHHGWSYHPTKVGQTHPHLDFDLLRAQFDACKEIGVQAPIYISAGVDNVASHEHPEWREVDANGQYCGWNRRIVDAGFHMMDFHSPYLDYLCEQIAEVVAAYPDADGIFLDIIHQHQSCGRWSIEFMKANGLDPTKEGDREESSRQALLKYFKRTTEACLSGPNRKMPVFHNSGHITPGSRDILPFFSHLELESLPTGGWGYDHFPLSAKYVSNLGLDYLGMTGKFHTTWGEFGGYKHPNALRYECASMLAWGAKCSIGDQLHPAGSLDESTYRGIGIAYAEVEAREPWCVGARSLADIAILSSESENPDPHHRNRPSDTGATRLLLEGHFLFTVIDRSMAFSPYRLLILPDDIAVDPSLARKLRAYLRKGGRILLSGKSGLKPDGSGFALNIGATWSGQSEYQPDFILPVAGLRPSFVDSPFVTYLPSQRIRATRGESLGQVFDPYFNRAWDHFCSHQHAPARPEASGYDLGVTHGGLTYLAHPIFTLYQAYGTVALKEFFENLVRSLIGNDESLRVDLPSTARATINDQPGEKRFVLHLLHAPTVARGGSLEKPSPLLSHPPKQIEVIEDLIPIGPVEVSLRLPRKVTGARLVPGGRKLKISQSGGRTIVRVPRFECHAMVELT
ncbi:MAG: alpha-amylase [Opitutaceae bacterium]